MPIYAYKCGSCGHSKDVLQKISDAPLTDCPACGASAFSKQVTAAGFQLKGSGWYATDFKGGGTSAPATDSKSDKTDGKSETKTDAKPADSTPSSSKSEAAPSASAGGRGRSSACH